MSSFTTATNEAPPRTQRRLLFEGFNVHESLGSNRQIITSTPEQKPREQLERMPSSDIQASEPCLIQLQNARQLLHSMSKTNLPTTNDQILTEDGLIRSEFINEANPELAYYKSSLESERSRRKQLETLIDVQQQRLTEAESELIQLKANDHKKTLCMKQLEQMIPNVLDEWKQKESEYKLKVSNLTQQIKQLEQANRDKLLLDKQQYEEQLSEKNLMIERLRKEQERVQQDYETVQTRSKQQEQRIQQLVKDADQATQRHSSIETELRNELKTAENRVKDIQCELERKQQEHEQMARDHHRINSDHNSKIRQLEHELDEQRRENNVLKMELDLREAKYRAQMESQKIQFIRDAETKISQRLEEQNHKHAQITDELNELHRRKLCDAEEKYHNMISNERQDYEARIQTLANKMEQMKNEFEHLQSTTQSERQDLARKLQDVFETALLKGSTKISAPSNELSNPSSLSIPILSFRSQPADTQTKETLSERTDFLKPLTLNSIEPPSISAIRSLSSRIDSLVDHTNRVTNGLEYSSRELFPIHIDNNTEMADNNQIRFPSSRPHSALQSPFFRSTPIDSMQDWLPSSATNLLTARSQSADPSSSGLYSQFPTSNFQQPTSNGFNLDSHSHPLNAQQTTITHYRSASSLATNFVDHQREIHGTISKDSIDKQHESQPSSNNDSLTRYVKMLLERSPSQDNNTNNHPLVKTNRSLHDIRLSIDQLNLAERDSKILIDDLSQNVHNESHSPRGLTPRQQKSANIKQNAGKVKKRLDYENHQIKQTNTNELFDRLSQPKTRAKKDKTKPTQQASQANSNGHNIWK